MPGALAVAPVALILEKLTNSTLLFEALDPSAKPPSKKGSAPKLV